MNLTALLTVMTDVLIGVTLIYCIVLERRIRAFRQQETTFRSLMGDVAESTREAHGAVSSLRRLLDEVGNRKVQPLAETRGSFSATGQSPSAHASAASAEHSHFQNPVSALALRLAALRQTQA